MVTVDVDPWVTGRAARVLAETGHANVRVVLGDAEHAADAYGPYVAIPVTVGAWDCRGDGCSPRAAGRSP